MKKHRNKIYSAFRVPIEIFIMGLLLQHYSIVNHGSLNLYLFCYGALHIRKVCAVLWAITASFFRCL
jgi:hypothetical protein